MNTVKMLFWIGIFVMVGGICSNLYTLVHAIDVHAMGANAGAFVTSVLGPIWQGGVLIGVSKIIELLQAKR